MRVRVIAGLVGLWAGCGGHTGGGNTGYDHLEIDPPTATLTVPLGGSATQSYTVLGVSKTHSDDITASCTLSIDSEFGTFSQATVTVGPHGGKAQVMAICDTQMGSAELLVNLTGSVVVGNAPPDSGNIFGGATGGTDPARTPLIEYPLDHAVSPRNIPPIEIQYTAAANDLFHIKLASTFAAIDVYTTDVQATLATTDWDAIAGTAAGDSLAFTIEGLARATPQTKYASAPVTVAMSRDSIDKTAIYYWASSKGDIMSQTFGEVTPPGVVKNDCTSCHSVSRSGSRIGYSRCVANNCNNLYAGFLHYDAPSKSWVESSDANNMTIHGSYTTFAPVGNPFPDDSKAVALVTMADGTLALYDPDTGTQVPSNIAVATHGPGAPRAALMADWSADGKKIVFTSTPHAGQWIDLSDGSIATMDYSYVNGQHTFGEPHFLVPNPVTLPSGTYTNFFFPSFSPDGSLVVFDAARAQWRNFTDARTAGQRLMLTNADGSWGSDLTALNGTGDNDITWAHWAPTISSDYYWIVFSSERDYGHEVTSTHTAPACVANGVK